MLPWKACEIGDHIDDVQTPALMLDLDAFERNLTKLMGHAKGVRVRPHAKSHKCPEIARRQIELGAIGICCQKLSEAAVFAQHGIKDILLTNQVVGAQKLQRLAQLAQTIRLGVLVDDLAQIQALGQAMAGQRHRLDVYIEIEVGAKRCGAPAQTAGELAQAIASHRQLNFAGLQCYHGAAQHLRAPDARAGAIANAAQVARQAVKAVQAAGFPAPLVTGAGTGTFWYERDSGVYAEVQAGSYALMDRDYADNTAGPQDVRFEHALWIKTSVTSVAQDNVVIVDAGLKSLSVDSGMPGVADYDAFAYLRASDEHGVIGCPANQRPQLGQWLSLIPGHCDPTVNLYDDLIVVQQNKVVDIWPIAARGANL